MVETKAALSTSRSLGTTPMEAPAHAAVIDYLCAVDDPKRPPRGAHCRDHARLRFHRDGARGLAGRQYRALKKLFFWPPQEGVRATTDH